MFPSRLRQRRESGMNGHVGMINFCGHCPIMRLSVLPRLTSLFWALNRNWYMSINYFQYCVMLWMLLILVIPNKLQPDMPSGIKIMFYWEEINRYLTCQKLFTVRQKLNTNLRYVFGFSFIPLIAIQFIFTKHEENLALNLVDFVNKNRAVILK